MIKYLKFFIYIILFPFFGKKKFIYINPQSLGGLIYLIYASKLDEDFNIIIDPMSLFKKNKFVNNLIFKIAYYNIKKKKINYFKNFFNYLFYKVCLNTNNFEKLSFKPSTHLNLNFINTLKDNKHIYFDYQKLSEDNFINDYILEDYIIFHCRDDAYKKKVSKIDYSYHSYRNTSLIKYQNALVNLKNKKLLRFGSIAYERCNSNNIFDYTFSKYRNEKNDLVLMKHCKFFVGTGSGPDILAMNFNKPIVYIDWLHLPNLFTYKNNTIVIFKKIFNKKKNCFLKVSELLDLNFKFLNYKIPVGLYYLTNQYILNDLEVIDNTEDEIYYAVNEMNEYLEGKLIFNKELQNSFRDLYRKHINLPISQNFYISEYFIKKNINLFC